MGDFGIVLVSNFSRISKFLNFFDCHVVRSFFVVKCFLKLSICSDFNAIFRFVEKKLRIIIVRSSEGNNVHVIVFVFSGLTQFYEPYFQIFHSGMKQLMHLENITKKDGNILRWKLPSNLNKTYAIMSLINDLLIDKLRLYSNFDEETTSII